MIASGAGGFLLSLWVLVMTSSYYPLLAGVVGGVCAWAWGIVEILYGLRHDREAKKQLRELDARKQLPPARVVRR